MALADADVERYARQIIIPSCGIEGQIRLLAARVAIVGAGIGPERALTYLRAAGCHCRWVEDIRAEAKKIREPPPDMFVVVQPCQSLVSEITERSPDCPIVWSYATDSGNVCSGVTPQAPIEIYAAPVPTYLAELAGTCAAAAACALILNWEQDCGPWTLDMAHA